MLLGISDLLEVSVNLKAVWRFVVKECGAQSVMMHGAHLMLMLYVDSLATLIRVSYYYSNFSYEVHVNMQVLLQEAGHFLAREAEIYCWMMYSVLELRPDSLNALIMALASTTVPILKMLELLVNLLQPHHVCLLYIPD